MSDTSPAVSVVIRTYKRPELVPVAVESALAQTLREIEVIVVVDGRDEETVERLRLIHDTRLRVIVPPRHLGNGGALNAGVATSTGRFVAMLDDDDAWLPGKLAAQLRTAARSDLPQPIVGCRLIARRNTHDAIWPRRVPHPGEPISEYLFCRKSMFLGEGVINFLTIFAPRALMSEVPFDDVIPRHVDFDWLLRASRVDGVGVVFVPEMEPLAIWHMDQAGPRVSKANDWRFSLSYAVRNRELFTRRSYAAFLLHQVSAIATVERDWLAFVPLLSEAFRRGKPSPIDVLSHLVNFLISDAWRRRGAALFSRGRAGSAAAPTTPGSLSR